MSNQEEPRTNEMNPTNATHGRRYISTYQWIQTLQSGSTKKKRKKKKQRPSKYQLRRCNTTNNNTLYNNSFRDRGMNNTTHGNTSPSVRYPPMVQATIKGPSVESNDSEAYGHNFPKSPNINTTIVTYQNIGPQTETIWSRAHHNARAFKSSNAGISFISEHGLNHYKIRNGHRYNNFMRTVDKTSYSHISHNANEAQDFGWKQYGGTGFTCTNNLKSNKTGHRCDPTGLSRWTWARFKGKSDSTEPLSLHTDLLYSWPKACLHRKSSVR